MRHKSKGKEKSTYGHFFWEYDNGDLGAVLVEDLDYPHPKGIENYIMPALLKSEREKDKRIEQLESREDRNELKIGGKKEKKIPVGIKPYRKQYTSNRFSFPQDREKCYSEFKKMITANGDDEAQAIVIKLLAAVLSGYFIRNAVSCQEVETVYPVAKTSPAFYVSIVGSLCDGVLLLNDICKSIVVSTIGESDFFEIEAPRSLSRMKKDKIADKAWLKVKGYTDYKWPAPYRDTSVLLDRVDKRVTDDFLSRNPWCVGIVYGRKYVNQSRMGISIKNFSPMDRIETDWDPELVNLFIQAYIVHICDKFFKDKIFLDIWKESGRVLVDYIGHLPRTDRKMPKAEQFKYRILLTGLLGLADFAIEIEAAQAEEVEELKKLFIATICPGYHFEKDNEAVQSVKAPSLDQIIKQIITPENLKHFFPITKRGQVWPTETTDGEQIWGYVRAYKDKKSCEKVINVVILRDMMINLVRQQYHDYNNISDVLVKIRKESSAYLHPTESAHITEIEGGGQISKTAYRLILSKIPISEECKKTLEMMLLT